MKITYRLAEEKDLPSAHRIMEEALQQFALERNLPPPEPTDFEDQLPQWRHFLGTSDEGFWVAEVKDRAVGFSCGIIRDSLWLLSYLVVHPEYQGQGIARELLTRALESSYRAKVESRAAYTDASNWASVSLFVKNGLFPWLPVLRLRGLLTSMTLPSQAEATAGGGLPSQSDENLEFQVLELSDANINTLGELDAEVRGIRRALDHGYWLGNPAMRCYLVQRLGQPMGYTYLADDGTVGPLAVRREEYIRPVLHFSINRLAEAGADSFQVNVPGANQKALSALYELGFHLQQVDLLLSSQPFGHWERYAFSDSPLL